MSEENKVRDVVDAVKGFVEAVPVYKDALQPAAIEIGTALQTVAKTIHIVLAPISALVWGFEQIKQFVLTRVAEKLQNVPTENIVTPPPHVAVPALEALRYVGHEETLRELYANLLATALDKDTIKYAHPSYVEIIKNMSPDEARIVNLFAIRNSFPIIDINAKEKDKSGHSTVMKSFSHLGNEASCIFVDLVPTYLDNLCRLGLAQIPFGTHLTAPGTYEPLENDNSLEPIKKYITEKIDRAVVIDRRVLIVTELGKQFCKACVIEKTAQ